MANVGVIASNAETCRYVAQQVHDVAVRNGRCTLYFDGHRFNWRSIGRENPEWDSHIVGVYAGEVCKHDIVEDMRYVKSLAKKIPTTRVCK